LPDAPGKQLVQKTCSTQCHDLGAILQARKSRAGWTDTVNGMTPQISGAQKQEIVSYLAKFLAPVQPPPSARRVPQSGGSSKSTQQSQPTGTPNLGGTMTTAGNLVFVGATLDDKFRAFDAATGKELWSYQLDGTAQATAMSFLGTDGKQYIAIASGGPGLLGGVHNTASDSPDKIVVFSLAK
jgi:outer membrane protein assembly factor BamB